MAFGIDAGLSRNTNNSVQVAEKENQNGDILEMHTFGGKSEVQEEVYSSSFSNEAINGQEGSSDIVTAHNLIEVNNNYAREQKTKVSALATQA